jgi:aspartate kinase
VEFAKKFNVPVRVLSSFHDVPGTLVTKEDKSMEKVVVAGVAYDKNQAKITLSGVPDKPGVAAKLFSKIADSKIIVDMIIQNVSKDGATDISFTVPKTDLKKALPLIKKAAKSIGCNDVVVHEGISKVSIIGVGMRSHSGVASRMFTALSNEGINIMMISTSEIKVSCVIDQKYTELAVRALHDAFGLEKTA